MTTVWQTALKVAALTRSGLLGVQFDSTVASHRCTLDEAIERVYYPITIPEKWRMFFEHDPIQLRNFRRACWLESEEQLSLESIIRSTAVLILTHGSDQAEQEYRASLQPTG